jgi:hypothetical protein
MAIHATVARAGAPMSMAQSYLEIGAALSLLLNTPRVMGGK